jgi:hypothetical protein
MTKKRGSESPYNRLENGVFTAVPQLHAVLVRNEEDAVGLNLKRRGDGDWIAVLRRVGDDGAPQVAFGTGFDLIGALLSLEGTVGAARWKEDKPWNPT